jgi:HMG-box domain
MKCADFGLLSASIFSLSLLLPYNFQIREREMEILAMLDEANTVDLDGLLDFDLIEKIPSESTASDVSKVKRTETWSKSQSVKKDSSIEALFGKPKRPLSAYNIFFQHEREKIVTKDENVSLDYIVSTISVKQKPLKRRHRKSHGIIGFAELARTIANRWKSLDESQKMLYEEKAAIEKEKYRASIVAWGSSQSDDNIVDDLYESALEIHLSDDDDYDPLSIIPIDCGSSDVSMPESNFSNLSMFGLNRTDLKPLQATSLTLQDYIALIHRSINMTRESLSLPLYPELPIRYNYASPLMINNRADLVANYMPSIFTHTTYLMHESSCQTLDRNSLTRQENSDFKHHLRYTKNLPLIYNCFPLQHP